jgi:hypothetical protein
MEQYRTHPVYTNYDISNNGNIRNNKTGRILKKRMHPKGYEILNVRKDKIAKGELVHRLVIEAWQGIIPRNLQVDHIDRNRKNNNIDNLRVVTPIENLDNRLVIGNVPSIVYNQHTNKFIVGDKIVDDIEEAINLFKSLI